MSDQSAHMNRRDFIAKGGMGLSALTTIPASSLFASSRVIGANDRIRIGLIGCGDRGQEDLKSALRQKNVECVAVADVYSRRREQVKSFLPHIDAYDDPMRLLD